MTRAKKATSTSSLCKLRAVPDPTIQFGILKCRDLTQLYYGARLVANVKVSQAPDDAYTTQGLLIGQDPRRIKYELIFGNTDNGTAHQVYLGTNIDTVNSNPESYSLPPDATIVVSRSFLTDLDAVTMEVWVVITDPTVYVAARETFLTPAPVDEGP